MGHPKPSVCRALQGGGWQAPQRVRRWTQDQLGCGLPQPKPLPVPCLASCTWQPHKRRSAHSIGLSACLPPTHSSSPGAFCFQGHLWPPFLRCVRARGLRSRCLAQIHILFLSLCNNQCSWWSWAELGPGREAGATSSWKPSAWPCCCDYHTPSCCTVSMV